MSRVRLTIPGDTSSAPLAPALAERFAAAHGLGPLDAGRLGGLVGALTGYVRERAYGEEAEGEIEVCLTLGDDAVEVAIRDWGEPTTGFGPGVGDPPAALCAAAPQAGDLRLESLGRDGKRLTARMTLETAPTPERTGPPEHREPIRPAILPGDVGVRDARPEDVEPISRLLYATYGLNYGHPDFYRPRWLAARLEEGSVRSTVAAHAGQVVGHHALLCEDGAPSAESGVAAVNPAYRGLGIFGRLFDHTVERARSLGLHAVFGRAVTVHPYSQRAEHAQGYREAALLLGAVPAWMAMRDIPVADPDRRTASLLCYLVLRPSARAVTLPAEYRAELERGYANLGLEIAAGGGPQIGVSAAGHGPAVVFGDDDTRATGALTVRRWDEAAVPELHAALRHVIVHHDDVLYADIDLHAVADPDAVVAILNDRSFFYAGLIPFGPDGHDHLRLQRVNAENVDTDHIVVDSPFAQALLADALADRVRVEPAP